MVSVSFLKMFYSDGYDTDFRCCWVALISNQQVVLFRSLTVAAREQDQPY